MNRQESRLKMDVMISALLIIGALLCACLIAAGVLWQWTSTGSPRFDCSLPATSLFQFWVTGIHGTAGGAFAPRVLINLGIAVLLLTPYLRVLASVIYFAGIERNIKYTVFTTFVFAVLTYSLFLR